MLPGYRELQTTHKRNQEKAGSLGDKSNSNNRLFIIYYLADILNIFTCNSYLGSHNLLMEGALLSSHSAAEDVGTARRPASRHRGSKQQAGDWLDPALLQQHDACERQTQTGKCWGSVPKRHAGKQRAARLWTSGEIEALFISLQGGRTQRWGKQGMRSL